MSRSVAARPPSPPQSVIGDSIPQSDAKRTESPREPYTPPRSILPAPAAEASYDPYGDPSMYQTAPQPVYYSPQPTFIRSMPYHTPPAIMSDTVMHARSGRALGSPLTPPQPECSKRSQSPRRKRKPKTRSGKNGTPVVEEPLSILTKDYSIPIRDMDAWVHRPVQERMKEVERKKGYISRPMNSFMLYRSAFAERVKKFCKENNHQVVSQVTGASWPLEPQHVREQYEKYASIERDNHQAAHPNYKFAPNKNGKKRAMTDDDATDGDDPDWESSTRSTKRSRHSRRDDTRSLSSTPFEGDLMPHYTPVQQYQAVRFHPSSYQYSNPLGPRPVLLGPNGMVGQYYQTTVTPFSHNVEDVNYGKMDDPFGTFEPAMPLMGMPNADHHDLLSPQGTGPAQPGPQLGMLDPRLGQIDPNYQYQHFDAVEHVYDVPRSYGYDPYRAQQEVTYQQEAFHPGLATLTDGQSVWPEADQAGSDFDNELLKWAGEGRRE